MYFTDAPIQAEDVRTASHAVYEDIDSVLGRGDSLYRSVQYVFSLQSTEIETSDDPLISTQSTQLVDYAEKPVWNKDSYRELAKIRTLPDNWDGEGAEAPNPLSLRNSLLVLEGLTDHDFRPDRIEASVEGGVIFTFRRGNLYCDFECFNNGEIIGVKSSSPQDVDAWEIDSSPTQLSTSIKTMMDFLNGDVSE